MGERTRLLNPKGGNRCKFTDMITMMVSYVLWKRVSREPGSGSPILQRAIRDDDSKRALPALRLPARDPRGDLRAARGALDVHGRDDARPVERQREARELVERAVLRVRHAEELRARRRAARGSEIRAREIAVRWARQGGGDGRRRAGAGGRRVAVWWVIYIYM